MWGQAVPKTQSRVPGRKGNMVQEFVVAVHATAAERKGEMSQRAEIMLELVVDVKNNRKSKSSALANTLESYLSQGSLRWLKESRVADTQLKNLTWERLIDPQKKVPLHPRQTLLCSLGKSFNRANGFISHSFVSTVWKLHC